MMNATEIQMTDVSCIDEGQILIAENINRIYEALASKKDISEVLLIVKNLIQRTEDYLTQRTQCQENYNCSKVIYAPTVIARIIELYNVIEQFGSNMSPAAAVTEIRNWAEFNIYQPSKRCKECDKVT